MFVYIIVVCSAVVMTSALLFLVLRRPKLLNYRTVLAIALSSVLSGLLFPGLFNIISSSRQGVVDVPVLLFIILTTIVLFIVLAFLLGIIISFVIPEVVLKAAGTGSSGGHTQEIEQKEGAAVEKMSPEAGVEENYLAEIYSSHVKNGTEGSNNGDNATEAENYLEKSVDSAENIDKMGLETLERGEVLPQDSSENSGPIEETAGPVYEGVPGDTGTISEDVPEELGTTYESEPGETGTISEGIPEEDDTETAENLSIGDCVDEAFRLKEAGDFEGAILYYMYALDRKPDKDLVFWIVLDICVLYKSLGQIDFAQEILSGYVGGYSDVMDSSVKEEIERNLLYV